MKKEVFLTCGVMARKMAWVMRSTKEVNILSLNSKSLKWSNLSLSWLVIRNWQNRVRLMS